jgi:hypothetical protein
MRAERPPRQSWLARAVVRAREDPYRLGVGVISAALATFLLFQMTVWPPHEDETLVFFVTQQPIGDVFSTVFAERGGAPLHWLLAYLAGSISPSLTALRLVSVIFAVASMPVIAALVARLTDKRTALVATALAAASWITIYHGIYARMYSLFLFLSALSFLTLLRAVGTRDPKRWAAWITAMVLTIATQPYGTFVLAAQAVYVLARRRREFPLRPAAISFGIVVALVAPLWLIYRVLASRFGIGLTGESDSKLGSPVDVLEYIWHTIGDFGAGWTAATAVFAALAVLGGVVLFRRRPAAVLLTATVLLVPTLALMATRSQSSVFLESRHLIFALPFFQMLVAAGLLKLAGLAGRAEAAAAVLVGLTALLGVAFAWGWHKTPYMYSGEPAAREQARDDAAAWLAATSRPDDILFGYEPLYLDAREAGAPFGSVIVQRADPRLAVESLDEASKPLGRGVWVFDASDQSDRSRVSLTIPETVPGPIFESRAWGPFLVIRTKEPVRDAEDFFRDTAAVELEGRILGVGDASINLQTAVAALSRLENR